MPSKGVIFSIKDSLNPPNDNQDNFNKHNISIITPFSQKDLVTAWGKYAATIHDKAHLKHIMMDNLPTLKENYQFEVQIFNPHQEQGLKDEAPNLIEFLRKELKNTSIEMIITKSEVDNKMLIYTNQEKFNLMADANENINLLVREFNLKFD